MVRVVAKDQKMLIKKHGIKIMNEFLVKNQNQKQKINNSLYWCYYMIYDITHKQMNNL